jgi:hypothetical protein
MYLNNKRLPIFEWSLSPCKESSFGLRHGTFFLSSGSSIGVADGVGLNEEIANLVNRALKLLEFVSLLFLSTLDILNRSLNLIEEHLRIILVISSSG